MERYMVLWISILISLLGLLALGAIVGFGVFLSRYTVGKHLPFPDFLERLIHHIPLDRYAE
jgi:hypothetical protein